MLKFISTIFLVILVLTSCISSVSNDGSDTLIKESSNNRRDKKAILFLREAGATVLNSYQVTVTDYNNKLDTTAVGNTFTVDTDHNKIKFDSSSINFSWLSNDTLKIDYDKNLRTFIQKPSVAGVTIIYVAR